ncbi:MAG TPA: L,D-transpeptidase family protein [Pyrinomonadaceae bacterium]|nr:L,D-transpeptidase family protein [Pyrinomonadaceae bacterium]
MIKSRAALIGLTICTALMCAGMSFSYLTTPAQNQRLTHESGDNFRGISWNPRDSAAPLPPLSSPRIVVKKGERKLFLYSGEKLIRTYHVGLGLSPIGDKVREGDRRTPEGDFYIFTKNDKSAFYLSLGISYPNAAHAERGLRDGLITKGQYDTILQALGDHKAPPQDTRLGGDIYIHGNGASRDWTWGCVALEDQDIRELFGAVSVGTPVTIKP